MICFIKFIILNRKRFHIDLVKSFGSVALFDKNFFENVTFDKLAYEVFELLNRYESWVKINGNISCDDKWDLFAQYYGLTLHSDELENY